MNTPGKTRFEGKNSTTYQVQIFSLYHSKLRTRLDTSAHEKHCCRLVCLVCFPVLYPTICYTGTVRTAKDAANKQHYEIDTEFYRLVLGPRLKYSSGYWPKSDTTFEESEVVMLEMYCQRAQLEDGMKVWRGVCATTTNTVFGKKNRALLEAGGAWE